MSNKLKFKVWHKTLNKMLYPPDAFDSMPYVRDRNGNHVEILMRNTISTDINGNPWPAYLIKLQDTLNWKGDWYVCGEKQDVEVLQFTDVRDIKGRDIYTGDVVKGKTPYNEVNVVDEIILSVGAFRFKHSKFGVMDLYDLELLGNKFENPELLT